MVSKEIIENLIKGDQKAFQVLYNNYWRQVYSFTKLYITTGIDVEEVVQEVFIKVWETRCSLDKSKSIEGLLFIMTRNLIFNQSRKSINELMVKMTTLQAIEETDTLKDPYNIEEEIDTAELKRHIDKLVLLLPPRQQEVFRMSREQHMSNKEIAQNCAISERAVERNINLALKFLKKNIYFFILFMR